MPKLIALLSAALLLLSGCSVRRAPAPKAQPLPVVVETPAPETDGLAGFYRNSELALTLTLDGCGAVTLTGAGTDAAGTYTPVPGGLALDFGTRQAAASRDAPGGFVIEGFDGRFVRSEDAAPAPGTETVWNEDGSFRYRDYDAHVACSCAAGTEILPRLLPDTVTAAVGADCYVTGQNVTEALCAFPGSAPEFLEDRIRTVILPDFTVLYGDLSDCGDLFTGESSVDGRLAEASLTLRSAEREIAVQVVLYTSAYADGTENYICKSLFAPPDAADALTDAVTGMCAVRKTS